MIAYIRKMAVEQKHWLDEDSFRYGVALCQTIPGATAMQTSAYVGLRARGVAGALASFAGFGLPAFIIMMALSALYVRTYSLPAVVSAFNGLQAIIVAIVANATVSFGRSYLKKWRDIIIAVAAASMLPVCLDWE
jgi:chromate transporter